MTTPTALKTAITDLAEIADTDLEALWQQASTPDEAREALLDVLPTLVNTYHLAASTISADWYDEQRDLVEARGRFTALPAEPDDLGAEALARWGIGPLFAAEPDWRRARVLVRGGMQLRIAKGARETVMRSSLADPAADGWQRVGDGSTCAFCSLLISRGAVYSEATADFAAHDSCGCSAVPAWGGQPLPVKPYTPSSRNITDADRARVRDYLRTH